MGKTIWSMISIHVEKLGCALCVYALAKSTYASVLKPRMRRMTTWTGGVSARSPSSPLLDIPRKVQKGTAWLKGRGGNPTPEPASGYSGGGGWNKALSASILSRLKAAEAIPA